MKLYSYDNDIPFQI